MGKAEDLYRSRREEELRQDAQRQEAERESLIEERSQTLAGVDRPRTEARLLLEEAGWEGGQLANVQRRKFNRRGKMVGSFEVEKVVWKIATHEVPFHESYRESSVYIDSDAELLNDHLQPLSEFHTGSQGFLADLESFVAKLRSGSYPT